MSAQLQPTPDLLGGAISEEVLRSTEPVLLRGIADDWPLVHAARTSDAAFCNYLRAFGPDTPLHLWRGGPEIDGRFFYNEDLSGFNFGAQVLPFGSFLDELIQGTQDTLYMGSTEVDRSLPGLRRSNDLSALAARHPLTSIWLGNRMRVAAHFDLPDNIACVVAGRRRFTLFPPDQLPNLYIGPLDLTPAGQPVSLVDPAHPDLERFPRYARALEQAQVFELLPGDGLFIPSQWWHAVEALAPVNGLVNFWWRQSPGFMDTPLNTLMYALLTLRDLPANQRDAWRVLFDHYVFEADEQTAAHIPEAARGILAPFDDASARALRSQLLNRLKR